MVSFRLSLELSTSAERAESSGGLLMSDWIDKLAEKDKANAALRQTQEELRLHRAKVISAKAPARWSAVIERLKADCSKLRNTFPDDKGRQCHVIENGLYCDLQGCKPPRMVLSMRLNVDGQSVDNVESMKDDHDTRVIPDARDTIQIGVASDESLEFTFKGHAYHTPETLAQALIMYVCRNIERPISE